jgi:hypothetical protein
MRTPLEATVTKPTLVEERPRVMTRDGASVCRPFNDILAEAEAVQDIVHVSGKVPPTASAVIAWREAWSGLCRGANVLMEGELKLGTASRTRQRRTRS